MIQEALRPKEVDKAMKQLPFLAKEQDDEREGLGFWNWFKNLNNCSICSLLNKGISTPSKVVADRLSTRNPWIIALYRTRLFFQFVGFPCIFQQVSLVCLGLL